MRIKIDYVKKLPNGEYCGEVDETFYILDEDLMKIIEHGKFVRGVDSEKIESVNIQIITVEN